MVNKMNHTAYADRKEDVSAALTQLLSSNERIYCYRYSSSYGITAFFHRLCYLLQNTSDVVCLYAELSDNSRSPVHEVIKKIVIKDGKMYQTLQLYADEYYGEHSQTLLESLFQDLPAMGETLAHIIAQPRANSIYAGYYPDVIKNLFFELVKNELSKKKVIIFIDNIQYVDSSSIYDILALTDMRNVTVVMSYAEKSDLAEKMLLEIEIAHSLHYIDFSEPSAECVQELWKFRSRTISKEAALGLVRQANGDIRKLVYSAYHGELPDSQAHSLLANEILIIIHTLQGCVSVIELLSMLRNSPTYTSVDEKIVIRTVHTLVQKGLLSSLLHIDGTETFSVRVSKDNQHLWNSLLPERVEALIYQDIVFRFLISKPDHDLDELKRIFDLAAIVYPAQKPYWARQVLLESLRMGTPVSSDWIDSVRNMTEPENIFLCAVGLFRTWKYADSLAIIYPLWVRYPNNRNVKILYSLSLNRCRKHREAQTLLNELIRTSGSADEKTLLLSIAISNSIHRGNEQEARKIFSENKLSAISSNKYGYFLRNAATLFQGDYALDLWNDALAAFRDSSDEYGELTTIANMARIYIRKNNTHKAISSLEHAYHGLRSYGIEQLHIVSNNLGIAYLFGGNIPNAKKQLRIARVVAKSIMPRTYITINDCCVMVEEGNVQQALNTLIQLKDEVDKSSIPRLSRRYYIALAGICCMCGYHQDARVALDEFDKFKTTAFIEIRNNINKYCSGLATPPVTQWRKCLSPAFLEYWISNPLSVMSDDALSPKAFIEY